MKALIRWGDTGKNPFSVLALHGLQAGCREYLPRTARRSEGIKR